MREPIAAAAPTEPEPTAYDRAQAVAYLRLLDGTAAGADWVQLAEGILDLDVRADRMAARACFDSHLARARWLSERGYAFWAVPPTDKA
ncbi:hypothetical protein BZG35_08490 [Brevundimonas sp. LM2]|uniref:DUF2285 domain-containing protein n=1 Tax=Brevundimonas sp. LM2 TaxID=1938605 RepID=UPI000983F05E|nr:DUF2285 domain-containing protein [Brevundimonas sp. LM2]AQR61685.1 hypothetical protein BZG35_08490 [Brevundimonas sp. LM2]